MTQISAQVTVYPLRRESLGPVIREARRSFRRHPLNVRVGEMSTMIWGEEKAVFDALQDAFDSASRGGDVVMQITLSNACPLPEGKTER